MKVRFQADADLNEDIVTGLVRREPRIDFQTADAAGLHGQDDSVVLARAAEERRVLVSHDRKTMPRHFAEFIQSGTSAGLLIVSQKLDLRIAIEELLTVWERRKPRSGSTISRTSPSDVSPPYRRGLVLCARKLHLKRFREIGLAERD